MFDDSFPYQQEAYTRGYESCVSDLRGFGYSWVLNSIKSWDSARDGFTLGYLTALGVHEERRAQ